jgi:hypothetical protein
LTPINTNIRDGMDDPIDRQSEVVMQAAGAVLLHDKDAPTARLPLSTHRLRRLRELSLPAIVFEWHFRPSHSAPTAFSIKESFRCTDDVADRKQATRSTPRALIPVNVGRLAVDSCWDVKLIAINAFALIGFMSFSFER